MLYPIELRAHTTNRRMIAAAAPERQTSAFDALRLCESFASLRETHGCKEVHAKAQRRKGAETQRTRKGAREFVAAPRGRVVASGSMTQSRLQALEAMAVSRPDDAMVHYGLGLEYRKAGDLAKAADAFSVVVRVNPEYTAAFQELGSVLVELGRHEDARRVFVDGVATAERNGASRARDHIGRLLAELDATRTAGPAEFCGAEPGA